MGLNLKMLTVNEGINCARTQKGAVLLDIRPTDVFKRGYVAGSINIPLDKLEENAKKKIKDQNAPVYVIGSADAKPRKAVHQMKKMGYTNVIPSGYMEDHQGFLKK